MKKDPFKKSGWAQIAGNASARSCWIGRLWMWHYLSFLDDTNDLLTLSEPLRALQFEDEIKQIKDEMGRVESAITLAEGAISECEKEIKELEGSIKTIEQSNPDSLLKVQNLRLDLAYKRKAQEQLRTEKEQLRTEKEQLRMRKYKLEDDLQCERKRGG